MMITIISQTDWIFKTDLILGIKEAFLFTALSMLDSIKTMISIPVRKTINEENKITYLNAFLRSNKEANSMSFVKNIEKIQLGLRERGFDLGSTQSCVTPVYLKGSIPEAMALVKDLRENYGVFCSIYLIGK